MNDLSTYSIAAILLAGGSGSRMGMATPKQYLQLGGKIVARHSLDELAAIPSVKELIVVCDERFRHMFPQQLEGKRIAFAMPGRRRQDSLCNGLSQLQSCCELICIHDAARPFLTRAMVEEAAETALLCGASTVGVPLKFTFKELSPEGYVLNTPDRSKYYEIQTPQLLRRALLERGVDRAQKEGIEVTDDVSFAELLGNPVKVVPGDYRNIKITTPEDLALAETFLQRCSA